MSTQGGQRRVFWCSPAHTDPQWSGSTCLWVWGKWHVCESSSTWAVWAAPLLLYKNEYWQHFTLSKLSKWSLTSGPWDPCWIHTHLDLIPFQMSREMWKNVTIAPLATTPLKLNETWGGKTNGEICENGWLQLLSQTEIGNLSEIKLPYKVSLYSGRDGQKCIFWAQISFHFSLGISLSYFLPCLSDPLAFSLALTM